MENLEVTLSEKPQASYKGKTYTKSKDLYQLFKKLFPPEIAHLSSEGALNSQDASLFKKAVLIHFKKWQKDPMLLFRRALTFKRVVMITRSHTDRSIWEKSSYSASGIGDIVQRHGSSFHEDVWSTLRKLEKYCRDQASQFESMQPKKKNSMFHQSLMVTTGIIPQQMELEKAPPEKKDSDIVLKQIKKPRKAPQQHQGPISPMTQVGSPGISPHTRNDAFMPVTTGIIPQQVEQKKDSDMVLKKIKKPRKAPGQYQGPISPMTQVGSPGISPHTRKVSSPGISLHTRNDAFMPITTGTVYSPFPEKPLEKINPHQKVAPNIPVLLTKTPTSHIPKKGISLDRAPISPATGKVPLSVFAKTGNWAMPSTESKD